MSKFCVEYKGVTCTDVDWGCGIFTMQYGYHNFHFKPLHTDVTQDEKGVLIIVKQFLEEMREHALDHFCEALKTIGEKRGEVGDDSYGAKGEKVAYLRGEADGLDYAYKWIPWIEEIPHEDEDDDDSLLIDDGKSDDEDDADIDPNQLSLFDEV